LNLLTEVAKDANSTPDAVRLTLTKSGWLPSMKYTEYVAKITETVISPEVQLKHCFLQSRVHSSATVSVVVVVVVFHGALAPRLGAFSA